MRYDLDFKLEVIAYYMQGHTGRATAEEFNLDNKIVIKWVKQYQSGGIEAIKPKTSKAYYSHEFKHKVITTMLSQGLSQLEVALRYNISSPALISHWHKAYRLQGMSGLTSKRKGRAVMSKPFITDKPDDEKIDFKDDPFTSDEDEKASGIKAGMVRARFTTPLRATIRT